MPPSQQANRASEGGGSRICKGGQQPSADLVEALRRLLQALGGGDGGRGDGSQTVTEQNGDGTGKVEERQEGAEKDKESKEGAALNEGPIAVEPGSKGKLKSCGEIASVMPASKAEKRSKVVVDTDAESRGDTSDEGIDDDDCALATAVLEDSCLRSVCRQYMFGVDWRFVSTHRRFYRALLHLLGDMLKPVAVEYTPTSLNLGAESASRGSSSSRSSSPLARSLLAASADCPGLVDLLQSLCVALDDLVACPPQSPPAALPPPPTPLPTPASPAAVVHPPPSPASPHPTLMQLAQASTTVTTPVATVTAPAVPGDASAPASASTGPFATPPNPALVPPVPASSQPTGKATSAAGLAGENSGYVHLVPPMPMPPPFVPAAPWVATPSVSYTDLLSAWGPPPSAPMPAAAAAAAIAGAAAAAVSAAGAGTVTTTMSATAGGEGSQSHASHSVLSSFSTVTAPPVAPPTIGVPLVGPPSATSVPSALTSPTHVNGPSGGATQESQDAGEGGGGGGKEVAQKTPVAPSSASSVASLPTPPVPPPQFLPPVMFVQPTANSTPAAGSAGAGVGAGAAAPSPPTVAPVASGGGSGGGGATAPAMAAGTGGVGVDNKTLLAKRALDELSRARLQEKERREHEEGMELAELARAVLTQAKGVDDAKAAATAAGARTTASATGTVAGTLAGTPTTTIEGGENSSSVSADVRSGKRSLPAHGVGVGDDGGQVAGHNNGVEEGKIGEVVISVEGQGEAENTVPSEEEAYLEMLEGLQFGTMRMETSATSKSTASNGELLLNASGVV